MDNKQTNTIKRRYNRISGVFDLMDRMIREKWRKELLEHASGKVLEVGVGTGVNLKYYPGHVEVTGIDFSPMMLKKAREKADNLPLSFELMEMDAQQMNLADNTFDTVVSTCVFCSVPDPIQGLKEIRRVTKPKGKIIMLEHMRSDNEIIGKAMDVLNPIGLHIVGANINRKTMDNIKQAGLKVVKEDYLMASIMRRLILSPNKDENE
ncbi:SAM-dependent methyltransferase [Thalassobacillus devorans]|uniref:SAM-dependent methyltransferase n=1 Tax=Thalassobacillus devorans TaxID=279813 RepID=A0ABQ1NQB0_9BACI|nr:class I SAM-dependent methyltransferase [Thalassobacillus devorans]NIK28891.1 ubiquinone/menaquinone biosynthesis C-methylase UbiE [Thalassobacillus devorans]GGC82811.1 SAM-dependent methyltransferase [Thalassobacillus devorans]